MAKIIFTKEARLADRIIRLLPKQKEVGQKLGKSQQDISYRIKNVYPDLLVEAIKLMEMAGYEVIEK